MTNDLDLDVLYSSQQTARWHIHAACVSQTVGQHVAGMFAVLEKFCPNPSVNLFRAILYHDAAEIKTGDWPHDMKEEYPELRQIEEYAALKFFEEHNFPEIDLTPPEKLWLKFADNFEVYVFLSQQVKNGNYLTEKLREIMARALYDANQIAAELRPYGYFQEASETVN